MSLNILGVIPARMKSTRFPGKVLAPIAGKPMIQHVYEKAQKAGIFDQLVVATDEDEVLKVVRGFGGEAIKTKKHRSGTDRVCEVAKKIDTRIVVNIQGDEPLVQPDMLRGMVLPLDQFPDEVQMTTLATYVRDEEALIDPNVVKVVFDKKGDACYFSRSKIPFIRDESRSIGVEFFKHLGFYAYQKETLLKLSSLPVSRLEQIEQLEQLRALENGIKIRVVITDKDTIGVDMPEDIKKVEGRMKKEQVST